MKTKAESIHQMLNANPHCEGAKALSVLIENSGSPIDCIKLNYLTDPPDFSFFERYIKEVIEESSVHIEIPAILNPFIRLGTVLLCDRKTIKDVYKRLNQLIAIKATLLSNPNPKLEEIETEISALKKYLSEVMRPGGAIKSYHPEQKRASQRISVAISRFLKKAEQEHPTAVAIIRQNLSMGSTFLLKQIEEG